MLLMLLLTAELTLLLAPTPAPYASAIYTMLPALPVPLRAIAQPILRPIYAMVLLISGPVTASPQFIQIRTLHRLFTSLSIGISQLAGVWSTPSPSLEQALLQATVMAKQLEADCESRFSVPLTPQRWENSTGRSSRRQERADQLRYQLYSEIRCRKASLSASRTLSDR